MALSGYQRVEKLGYFLDKDTNKALASNIGKNELVRVSEFLLGDDAMSVKSPFSAKLSEALIADIHSVQENRRQRIAKSSNRLFKEVQRKGDGQIAFMERLRAHYIFLNAYFDVYKNNPIIRADTKTYINHIKFKIEVWKKDLAKGFDESWGEPGVKNVDKIRVALKVLPHLLLFKYQCDTHVIEKKYLELPPHLALYFQTE